MSVSEDHAGCQDKAGKMWRKDMKEGPTIVKQEAEEMKDARVEIRSSTETWESVRFKVEDIKGMRMGGTSRSLGQTHPWLCAKLMIIVFNP